MRKRIMAVLLAVCVMAGAAPCVEADVQAEEMDTYVGLDAEYHTQDEIKEYYKIDGNDISKTMNSKIERQLNRIEASNESNSTDRTH